jgi:Resolvase, N terminal domain
MDGKFIAYYRVSTDRQGMNGNGMAAQRKAVEDYLNGGRWKLVGEFTEGESGKRALARTCMDNRRATVPSSDVKDAVGASAYSPGAPAGVACLESTLPCREGQSAGR